MPIPGFDSDKCQKRNLIASKRDGVNALPFTFLNHSDVYKTALAGGSRTTGKLPKNDAEAFAMIKATGATNEDGSDLNPEDIYWFPMEAANNSFIPDRFMFMDDSTLKNIASNAMEGFAFMNSHRTGGLSHQAELPFGQTFAGRYEHTDEGTRAVVCCYMLKGLKPNGDSGPSTDDLARMIHAKTIKDVSVGLYGGTATCDVCGADLDMYDCDHVPGTHYGMNKEQKAAQKARSVPEGKCSYTLVNAYCGEVSAVYDGAVPGAGFRRAASAMKQGGIDPEILSQIESVYAALLSPNNSISTRVGIAEPPTPPKAAHSSGEEGKPRMELTLEAFQETLEKVLSKFSPAKHIPDAPAVIVPAVPVVDESAKNELALLKAHTEELAKMVEDQKLALAQSENAAKLAVFAARVEDAKRKFLITPATGDKVIALAEANLSSAELALDAFEENGPIPGLAPTGGKTVTAASLAGGSDAASIAVQLNNAAREYMKTANCSYADAVYHVSRNNPELAQAYLNAAPATKEG